MLFAHFYLVWLATSIELFGLFQSSLKIGISFIITNKPPISHYYNIRSLKNNRVFYKLNLFWYISSFGNLSLWCLEWIILLLFWKFNWHIHINNLSMYLSKSIQNQRNSCNLTHLSGFSPSLARAKKHKSDIKIDFDISFKLSSFYIAFDLDFCHLISIIDL